MSDIANMQVAAIAPRKWTPGMEAEFQRLGFVTYAEKCWPRFRQFRAGKYKLSPGA